MQAEDGKLIIKKTDLSETNGNEVAFIEAMHSPPVFGKAMENDIYNLVTVAPEIKTNQQESNILSSGIVTHWHPVNWDAIHKLKDISGHHSSCIQTKKCCTIGLGFVDDGNEVNNKKIKTDEQAREMAESLLSGRAYVNSKVDDILNNLCTFSFYHHFSQITEDFMDMATGYMEVVRDSSDKIISLSFIPYGHLVAMTFNGRLYYRYSECGAGPDKYFSVFGLDNKKWLLETIYTGPDKPDKTAISEVIPFILPSNRQRYYGYPDWISACIDIEMLKKAKQYKSDFYWNRGVIDKFITVMGQVDPKIWKQLVADIQGTVGAKKNFGTVMLNLGDTDAEAKVHNLGAEEGQEDQYAKDSETFTQSIVSAHAVPPLLANILIPGKLGASNEYINSLISFQLLRINHYQSIIEKTLANTLGGPEGIAGLKPDDFRLRTITGQIDVLSMDTMSKMRSEAVSDPERDLTEGVKD